MPTEVSSDDLEQALMWVSASPGLEAAAYVSRASGKVCFVDPDVTDDGYTPGDLEDDSLYASVPHKNDLALGRALVLRFVDEAAPELRRDVAEVFRRKGAYSRFKAILQRRGLLDAWHAYEADATRRALEQWAKAEGFVVVKQSGA